MATPELKPAYLIVGGDGPKIARALQRLRERIGEESVELLSARDTSGDDAVAACNALGLFAGGTGRLVVVSDAEQWKAADVKALAAYLEAPAPDTVIALTGDVKPASPLGKAVAKRGEVLAYDYSKRALPRWVAEQLARLEVKAEPDAAAALVELVGEDLDALTTEIEKLAVWAGDDTITARDVELLATARAETSIFALTDAWGRRDVAAALGASEELLERSDRPRRDELMRLSGLLVSHVGRVRRCQALADEGLSPGDAATKLKVHPFAAEKAFAQARNFSAEELRGAIVRLAELDLALKGGSRLAGDLEFQRALVEITRPAEAVA
ncbi:MAG: DNA polymerase III subunit delta [Gaiellaceae bacterium]